MMMMMNAMITTIATHQTEHKQMKNKTMKNPIQQELHQQELEKKENMMKIWDKQFKNWNRIHKTTKG